MFKSITIVAATAAALLSATANAGEAPTEKRFTRDGETYVYTTKVAAKGTVIEGRRFPSGSAFRLHVGQNGRVTGTSGGHAVAFRAVDAKGSALVAIAD